jgi:hypothetical protein
MLKLDPRAPGSRKILRISMVGVTGFEHLNLRLLRPEL